MWSGMKFLWGVGDHKGAGDLLNLQTGGTANSFVCSALDNSFLSISTLSLILSETVEVSSSWFNFDGWPVLLLSMDSKHWRGESR